jgi:hypothetical protein
MRAAIGYLVIPGRCTGSRKVGFSSLRLEEIFYEAYMAYQNKPHFNQICNLRKATQIITL